MSSPAHTVLIDSPPQVIGSVASGLGQRRFSGSRTTARLCRDDNPMQSPSWAQRSGQCREHRPIRPRQSAVCCC
jgi:hypothetical protein